MQYTYSGWSSVSRMENNEPPLMQCYSNPKKAKLTTEVRRDDRNPEAFDPKSWILHFISLYTLIYMAYQSNILRPERLSVCPGGWATKNCFITVAN